MAGGHHASIITAEWTEPAGQERYDLDLRLTQPAPLAGVDVSAALPTARPTISRPRLSRACVLALRCAIRRAGGPCSRRLCLVERILPFRHAVGNDSRRRQSSVIELRVSGDFALHAWISGNHMIAIIGSILRAAAVTKR